MPVLLLECPDCGHRFRSLVVEGAKTPAAWVCSRCKSRRVAPVGTDSSSAHPWADGPMDACCG